jgi:hypothetical protein
MRTVNNIEMHGPESCLKPVGELASILQRTTTGDMLLFMIALDRQARMARSSSPTEALVIGFND